MQDPDGTPGGGWIMLSRRISALVLAAAVLAAALSVGTAPAMAAEAATFKTASVTRDGMTMLPFRETLEAAGAKVSYSSQSSSFYAELNGNWIWAPVYDNYATINGYSVKMSRAPVVVQGTAYFPQDLLDLFLDGWRGGWTPAPGQGTGTREGLKFSLVYEAGNPGRIGLVVENTTSRAKTLTFPSGKTHEIVLKQNGARVWSSADGKVYTQSVKYETLRAGQSKTYWTDLPRLASGTYRAEAYFSGISYKGVVASTTINHRGSSANWYDPLKYSLSYQAGLFGILNPPKLVLTVKNPTGSDVVFPGKHTYEFVIWGYDGSETRKTLPGMSQSNFVQKIAAGASQTHFIYLNGIKKGTYYAEGYIKQDGRIVKTIGGLTFTVR